MITQVDTHMLKAIILNSRVRPNNLGISPVIVKITVKLESQGLKKNAMHLAQINVILNNALIPWCQTVMFPAKRQVLRKLHKVRVAYLVVGRRTCEIILIDVLRGIPC